MPAAAPPMLARGTSPIPARAQRLRAVVPSLPAAPGPAAGAATTPVAAPAAIAAAASLSFPKQIGLGLAIFAAVLAAALPFAFVSEGLALAAAVGVGSVLLALLARRSHIALLIAALLAVLGAFGATPAIHLSLQSAPAPPRLAALAPAAGIEGAYIALPGSGGARTALAPLAGWAFPAALFALWAAGFAAAALNRALLRWARRRIGEKAQRAPSPDHVPLHHRLARGDARVAEDREIEARVAAV